MKISKIEPQKRNKKRSSIYINGEYRLSLSNELIMKCDLHVGDEITEEEIKNILFEKEKEYIKGRAYKILRYRDRSSEELKQRLLRIGFDEPMIEQVIQGFIEDKTLDDNRFVQEFVSDYTKINPKGNKFIFHELRKKGIPPEIIEKAVGTRNERTLAEAYLKKKFVNLNLNHPKDKQKIWRRLVARGFSPEVVYDILKNYEESRGS